MNDRLSLLLIVALGACDGGASAPASPGRAPPSVTDEASAAATRAPEKPTPEGSAPEQGARRPPAEANAPATTPAAAPAASPPITGERAGPLEIVLNGRPRKPSSIRPSTEPGMTDEPHQFGWSATTGEFMYCVHSGGADCERCRFYAPTREAAETVEIGTECSRPSSRGELEARRRSGNFAVTDGPWAFGDEIVLVVSEGQGKPDSSGLERGFVRVGARLRAEGSKTGWGAREVSCSTERGEEYCAPDLHLDVIAPSPDGAHVVALTHSFAGEFSDGYSVTIYDAGSLAAKAYNAEGLARLKAEEFPRAAALFERVAALDPTSWKGPYNLACVHARAGEKPGARAALEEAIRRGGDAVRSKLARDRDLDGVRDEPWFSAL